MKTEFVIAHNKRHCEGAKRPRQSQEVCTCLSPEIATASTRPRNDGLGKLLRLQQSLGFLAMMFCSLVAALLLILPVNIAHGKTDTNIPISLEVQTFGNDVFFIFYHDKHQLVHLSSKGNKVSANINIPGEVKLATRSKFNQYASDFQVSPNGQLVSFTVKDEFEYSSVVNGEKLDAIKFHTQKTKAELEDLSNLGAANNDPGAIKYLVHGDDHQLNFNLRDNNSSIAAFFRGKYLWIVFDQKKNLSFKNEGIFSDFEPVPSSGGTAIRLKVKDGYQGAKVAKINDGFSISITKKSDDHSNSKNILRVETSAHSSEDEMIVHGSFGADPIISFHDPDIGDIVNVLPVKTIGERVIKKRDSHEFSVLKSAQGLAIALYNDDVKIIKSDKEVKITAVASLPDHHVIHANMFGEAIDEYIKLPTILPYRHKDLDILNFNEQRSNLIREAAESKDANESFARNLDLAKFYFVNGWYQESSDALQVAKAASPESFRNHLQARFLMAVDFTMVDDYISAKDEYDALLKYENIAPIAEINLWNKYNNFSLGGNPGSIGFLENMAKTISYYSDDKYWPMFFAEIELALLANDLKTVEKLLKIQREASPGSTYANSIKFYQAEYYRKKDQNNLAKQYYKELTGNDKDLFNSTRAEFSLVKLQVKDGDIDDTEAINRLEALRFSWRGDQLEYEILMQLAIYYKDNNDIMNALRTYQYIQLAFNNTISNFHITSEMAKIFNDVFLPGGLGEKMDDFTVVALFYEFKELNPIGEQGDDVIIGIAKRLVRLDLLENAAGLLRHQVKFRLHGEKKITNADNLAIILLMDKKPNEAILVLDDTDRDNFSFKEHQYRTRLRARALLDQGNYESAIEYIKDDNSPDAEVLRREILFQSKNWNGYIDRINNDFEQIVEKLDNDNSSEVQDILRLAISYYMLNQQDALTKLAGVIGTKNQMLTNTINLLITSSEPVDYKNLDQSLNIDQMKNLLDKYKNQFLGG